MQPRYYIRTEYDRHFAIPASEPLDSFLRVNAHGGLADKRDADIGTVVGVAKSAGDWVTITPRRAVPTWMIAGDSINPGSRVFAGDDGRVAKSGPVPLGHSIFFPATPGSRILVIRGPHGVGGGGGGGGGP